MIREVIEMLAALYPFLLACALGSPLVMLVGR